MIKRFKRHIKARIRKYKSDKFLKKHNCKSWSHYNAEYDPDYDKYSDRISGFYKGYKHVHVFRDPSHYAYSTIYDHGPAGYRNGFHDICDWCVENCKGKIRFDGHRMLHLDKEDINEWIIFNNVNLSEYSEYHGLTNYYVFIAFKEEEDYIWFKMRWA